MDLLTHAVMGAVTGEALLGRRLGARGAAWGAALGLLPDVDALLLPFLGDLEALTVHRSLTHSLPFLALAAPTLAWLLRRRHPDLSRARCLAFTGLTVGGAVGLDLLTTWGTQVLWPFSQAALTLRLVSIVDPLLTLPLLACLAALFLPREGRLRRWLPRIGLGWVALYLLLLGGAKLHVGGVLERTLAAQGVVARRTLTKPTLGQGLLWRLVAETDHGYWVGYRSLLDEGELAEHVRTIPRQAHLLGDLADDPDVARLLEILDLWAVVEADGAAVVVDVRYGQWRGWEREESPYVFAYRLERTHEGVRIEALPRAKADAALRRSFLARIRGR